MVIHQHQNRTRGHVGLGGLDRTDIKRKHVDLSACSFVLLLFHKSYQFLSETPANMKSEEIVRA